MSIFTTPAERFADITGYDYPYERTAVTDDGAAMAYVDVAGSGDETFVLLHGEPTWGYLYRKLIPTLSDHGRVIVPDMLGLGRSDKYLDAEDYSFELLYESYERLLFDELDLENITLVCQDWGGILGLTLLGHHPERFARVVAMNTLLADGTQTMPEEWHEFAAFVEETTPLPVGGIVQGATADGISNEVRAAYDAPFPTEESKACVRALPGLIPRSPEDEGADLVQAARERLAEWEQPAFVLFSDGDPITRFARDPLRELFPRASEQPDIWIAGAMHFLQEDAGREIAEEIAAFVERT